MNKNTILIDRKLRESVDALLQDGYALWDESELAFAPPNRYAAVDVAAALYDGSERVCFAAACQCFYLFRELHAQTEAYPVTAILLGDWFFSRFSQQLIPIDNVALTDAFAAWLAKDAELSAESAGQARAGDDHSVILNVFEYCHSRDSAKPRASRQASVTLGIQAAKNLSEDAAQDKRTSSRVLNDFAKRRLGTALTRDLQDAIAALETELLQLCGDAKNAVIREELCRVTKAGGKRLRPMLAYLCFHMGKDSSTSPRNDDDMNPAFADAPLPLMCMLELMHSVSLIHDDIVDNAETRRGVPTIARSAGISVAVQSGDFLLAKAMEKLKYYRGMGINEMLAGVAERMCLGELKQQDTKCLSFFRNARTFAQNPCSRTWSTLRAEPVQKHASSEKNPAHCKEVDADELEGETSYYEQIACKTAALLAASCKCGALAGGMSAEDADRLGRFGERFGLAFQIMDDVMDFEEEECSGKQSGRDVAGGILTLPILLLREIPDEIRILLAKRDKDENEIRLVLEHVRGTGALTRAEDRIRRHCMEAIRELASLRNGPEKEALVKLAEALAGRRAEAFKTIYLNSQKAKFKGGRKQ